MPYRCAGLPAVILSLIKYLNSLSFFFFFIAENVFERDTHTHTHRQSFHNYKSRSVVILQGLNLNAACILFAHNVSNSVFIVLFNSFHSLHKILCFSCKDSRFLLQ